MTQTKTKLTAENLMVIPLNMDAIHAELNAGSPETTVRSISYRQAIVVDAPILVDDECVCEYLKTGDAKYPDYPNLHGKEIVELEVYKKEKVEKGWSCEMTPSSLWIETVEDLKAKYSLPAISLKEFMADRYNYNSRIGANMGRFIEWVEEKTALPSDN